jgi:hypothetical protein
VIVRKVDAGFVDRRALSMPALRRAQHVIGAR